MIGVLALRFTSGIFLKLLDIFSRLETAGYVAILIVGIKLLLNTLIKESILPDYYFYILIIFAFIWGFSKKNLKLNLRDIHLLMALTVVLIDFC